MMKVGFKPGAMPRTKPGDYERAWAVNVAAAGDLKVRKYLAELVAVEAAIGERETAVVERERVVAERDKAAQAAEANAIRARQALADETAAAQAAHAEREVVVTERERVAGEVDQSQDARDADLKRREEHLSKAGVRGF